MPSLVSRGRGRRTINEINMVPFIDVMLVLLIIFMVTAPMITPSMVDLPSVGKAAQRSTSVVEVIVGVDEKLKLRLDNGDPQPTTLPRLGPAVKALQAGNAQVPVVIREVPDNAALAMALIENIQRENLNPIEEANGIQRLIDEFNMTHETAAQAVGRSRSAASNLLRLLNLAEPVQTMLMAGDIDMGHARALLGLDKAAQITAANQISAKKMSVREAESLVKKLSAEFSLVQQKPKKEKSRDIKRVEEELSDLLTAQVEVRIKKRVKRHGRFEEMGELSIQFGSLDELNGLIDKLRA